MIKFILKRIGKETSKNENPVRRKSAGLERKNALQFKGLRKDTTAQGNADFAWNPRPSESRALEDDFLDFPPYDCIWEAAFTVYKWHSDTFCLEEWPRIFTQLTAPHEDGLNVRRDSVDEIYCGSSNNWASTNETNAEKDFVLQQNALMIQQLLLQKHISVSETLISECLTKASNTNSDCSKFYAIDEDAEFTMQAFGDFSSLLNEASLIVGEKLSGDALVSVLTCLITQSKPPAGDSVCTGARNASLFTENVVASMEKLLEKELKQYQLSAFKDTCPEDHALLNLIEKVIYLCLRTGYHLNLHTRNIIHSFATKVWSERKNDRFEEMFTKKFPFFMYKLIVWDNLDRHHQLFTMRTLSKLFRPFKTSLRAVILLSKTPIFECMEVIAMISCRRKKETFEHDEIEHIQRLSTKMLLEGLHSEAMDDNVFAYSMLEYKLTPGAPYSKQSPLRTGPIGLALKHEIGEFLCLQRPQEILEIVWYGELHELLYRRNELLVCTSPGQLWNSDRLFLNTVRLTHYRTCPYLVAFLDFIAWGTFLACTYSTVLLKTNADLYDKSVQFTAYHYILFSLTAGFFATELHQLMKSGFWDHFDSLWNAQDAVIILTVAAFAICEGSTLIADMYAFQALTIISILVLFRTLYFATIFRSYGMLVSALFIMMGDVIKFLTFFLVILAGFAVVMVSFFPDCEQFGTFSEAFKYLFSAGLANYDYDWFEGTLNPTGGVVILTIYVIIANVILLNMLIAILADTYSNMTELSHQSSAVARANFIQEYDGHGDFPVPWNFVSLCCNLVCFFLKGKTKVWWDYGCLLLYRMLDLSFTVLVIGPYMCIMDCSYIASIFIFSIFEKFKNHPEVNFQDSSSYRSALMQLLSNVVVIIYATIWLFALLSMFIVAYFVRLSYKLILQTTKSDHSEDPDSEFSFQQFGPCGKSEHHLRILKQSMMKGFHFEDDDTEDLLCELDSKVSEVMISVNENYSQNSEKLQELEERLTDEFSQELQHMTKKMDRLQNIVIQRCTGIEKNMMKRMINIEKVNSQILALLEKIHSEGTGNNHKAIGNLFDFTPKL